MAYNLDNKTLVHTCSSEEAVPASWKNLRGSRLSICTYLGREEGKRNFVGATNQDPTGCVESRLLMNRLAVDSREYTSLYFSVAMPCVPHKGPQKNKGTRYAAMTYQIHLIHSSNFTVREPLSRTNPHEHMGFVLACDRHSKLLQSPRAAPSCSLIDLGICKVGNPGRVLCLVHLLHFLSDEHLHRID